MGRVKLPYYRVIKGRGYFCPTPRMKAVGFRVVPCGPDGPDAWRVATEWNSKWQAARTGREPPPRYTWPRGSLGEAFEGFRRSESWRQKAPRTREDWDRGWKWISPIFGDVAPATVTFDQLDEWYWTLLRKTSTAEAFRAMKIWRALWQVTGAMGYCRRDSDPSAGIRRRAPAGRSQTWTDGEAARLVKGAWRLGYRGLAALIAVSYDTGLAPVDCRGLTPSQRSRDGQGTVFLLARAKTGRAAAATLSRRSDRVLGAYLEALDAEPLDNAPIFRNRSGKAYTKDTLGDDFRRVRAAVFGASETRRLQDMRRTMAVEAFAGGADPAAVSAKMANTISDAKTLQRTYVPVDIATVREADDARRIGRRRIRENKAGAKVETPDRRRVETGGAARR